MANALSPTFAVQVDGEDFEIDGKWGIPQPSKVLKGLEYGCGGDYRLVLTAIPLLDWGVLTEVYDNINIRNAQQRPLRRAHWTSIQASIASNLETFFSPVILNTDDPLTKGKDGFSSVKIISPLHATDGQHRLMAFKEFLKTHLPYLSPKPPETSLVKLSAKEIAEKLKQKIGVQLLCHATEEQKQRIFVLQARGLKISQVYVDRISKSAPVSYVIDQVIGNEDGIFPEDFPLSDLALWKVTSDDPNIAVFNPPFQVSGALKALKLCDSITLLMGSDEATQVLWKNIFIAFSQIKEVQQLTKDLEKNDIEARSSLKLCNKNYLVSGTPFNALIRFIGYIYGFAALKYMELKSEPGNRIDDLKDFEKWLKEKVNPVISTMPVNKDNNPVLLKCDFLTLTETTLRGVKVQITTQDAPLKTSARVFAADHDLLDSANLKSLSILSPEDLNEETEETEEIEETEETSNPPNSNNIEDLIEV